MHNLSGGCSSSTTTTTTNSSSTGPPPTPPPQAVIRQLLDGARQAAQSGHPSQALEVPSWHPQASQLCRTPNRWLSPPQLVVQALQLHAGREGAAPILQQAAQHAHAARAADELAALLDLVALHTGAAAGGGGLQVGGSRGRRAAGGRQQGAEGCRWAAAGGGSRGRQQGAKGCRWAAAGGGGLQVGSSMGWALARKQPAAPSAGSSNVQQRTATHGQLSTLHGPVSHQQQDVAPGLYKHHHVYMVTGCDRLCLYLQSAPACCCCRHHRPPTRT
jgi:hypothetical protein